MSSSFFRNLVATATCASLLAAQAPPTGAPGQPPPGQAVPGQPPPGQAPTGAPTLASGQLDRLRPNYVLRPGDQILIRAAEMDDISERPFRIDGDGFITLPTLGRIQAGGVSVERLEAQLVEMLRKYLRTPQASITVTQFSSEPVFFVGAFRSPGIYPLQGRRNLVEMMASIGGLQPNASRRLKVTRPSEYGRIPLPSSQETTDGKGTFVEINMASLRENVNPAEDIVLQPFDVISVERAEMVYVSGAVAKTGAFELDERESISAIKAITLAGGLTPEADPKKARILRPVLNSPRRAEIPLNLQAIFEGKASDMPLLPNDVLVVSSAPPIKSSLVRNPWVLLSMATSIVSLVFIATQ
jgi:polysaccharide biosynthesis/export protein